MDYDDNDFQSQNLHIAGEGGNKFPPVLQSYALPKFDFDDNLHGHLRFDSLVETEVFLGIENNEDNQWIEDFSRGSSGIQFSSTAAEPCSIPRRNNVWSEATSSESVEMLLKSVGQEEIIPVQNSIRESDACDELGCIMKQMEPNLKQDNTTVKNVGDLQPTLSTCEIPDNSPLLDSNDGVQQPVVSPTRKVDAPVDGGADDATASAEVGLPLTAGGTSVDDKTNINNQSEDISMVDECFDNGTQRESASEIEHDCAADSMQNITSNDNARNLIIETTNDGKNVLEMENSKNHEKENVVNQELRSNDLTLPANVVSSGSGLENPVCSASIEPVEGVSAVGTKVNVEEHSCSMPKENSGSSEHMVIDDQLEVKKNEMALMGFEGNATFNSKEVKESEVSQLDKNLVDDTHLLSAEHHKDSIREVVECGNRCIDNSPNEGVACSSAELDGEGRGKILVSSSTIAESRQASEKDIPMGQGGVCKQDESGSMEDKKGTVFPSAGSHGDAPDIELESTTGNELESAIGNASVDDVPMSSGIGIATDLTGCREEEISPLPVSTLNQSDKEEIAVKKSSDAKTGKGDLSGTVGQMLLESANESSAMVDACNVKSQSYSEATVSNKASQEFAKNTEVRIDHYDSAENKEDDATVLEKENDKKAVSTVSEPDVNNDGIRGIMCSTIECADNNKKEQEKNETVPDSGDGSCEKLGALVMNECERRVDQDKVTSGSQTVVGNKLSQSESEKDGMRSLTDQTVSVAEVTSVDADKVLTISQDPKQTDASKDETSLSVVEVSPLVNQPKKEAGPKSQTGSKKRGSKASMVVDGSLSTPRLNQSDSKVVQDVSQGNPKVTDVATVRSGSKGTSDRRPRRASGKSTGKEITKKGTSAEETASVRRGDKIGNVSMSPSVAQLVHSNEIPCYVHADSGGLKPFVLATSTSGLPDLNSASSVVFQQPFTDLQQVQLRAQIFVYGALIQGTAPDEPYMISAFGGLDGGRSIWESAWRSCMERLQGQKSHLINPETPLQPRSGVKVTPSGRSSKGTPTTIVSPMLPVSSPLWNMPTPTGDALQSSGVPRGPVLDYQRALSPLHPHQTPPTRNFVGHNPSWISQAPFGPWVGTPQSSSLDAGGRFSVHLPVTEAVQLTPVRETLPHPLAAKHVPPGPVVQSEASAGGLIDVKKVAASSGQSSADPKPRKRKKTLVPENQGHGVLQSPPQTVSVPSPVVGSQPSSAAAIAVPVGFGSATLGEKLITSVSPAPTSLRKGSQNAEQRTILSDETLGKVKETRLLAEDAAAVAAAAVNHSQEVWNQLEKQRSSGLSLDVETKLASAAVAIAAAAAVAKAAAAAANVASNAALQAKLMADEAVVSGSCIHPSQSSVISFSDGMKNLGKATPASILKGDDGTNASSSILVAAREAARKRVEAASAASKRAENMDAIVKAAELALEAVSQAGKIVAMGDPLPLGELIAAGPEGYWKSQVSSELGSQLKEVGKVNVNAEAPDMSASHSKMDSLEKRDTFINNLGKPSTPNVNFVEDHVRLIDSLPPVSASAKDLKGQKGNKVSDLAKTIGVIPESESGQRSSFSGQDEHEITLETSKDGSIQEGSHVEVFKDGNGFKAAWFSASVLSLKDGKAYVSYNDLTSGEGLEKLKEWVLLKGEGNSAPEIRVARPITAVPFEGTRKRRRAAIGDYNWSVGDRVDAWIQDRWCEGVITEKNKKDETTLTVHFPAQGETSTVRAWHLRPSLTWKDGEWIEWSSSRENDHSAHSGDTPQEKRPRVQSPTVEAKGKDKTSTSSGVMDSDKPREPTLLELTADQKIFNIGKSNRDGNKHDTLRMTRTGLQKEGSKVIFGVPKPGKKRKFMEVSKHYVADRSGKTEASDSVKFTKYLMPQGTGSRGWKNTSKNESIGKRPLISKPRGVKSGKVQNVSGRSVAQKDSSRAAVSAPDARAGTDNFAKTKDSASHGEEDASGKQKPGGFQSVSSSEGAADGSTVFSSLDLPTDTLTSKKSLTVNAKPERASKGKLAPAGGKLGKIEEEKGFSGNSSKSTSDPIEPRRSNRRIQPTSRLLEGLQSSLMVSKIPSVSHDKSHKNRSTSRGNN